jgi:hypothetical protein
MQDENGIVTAPIRRDLSDERLQEITGGNFIGSVNVMVYDK